MKKALLVCLMVLLSGCVRQEDLYQGRPASYWLKEIKNEFASARWRAAVALGDIGPRAGKRAVVALSEALKDEDDIVRWAAASSLGKFGPDAKLAIPSLKEMIDKERSRAGREAALASLKLIDASTYYNAKTP
ncbi:MAG: HEAT repeat domain-containing protein [Gemmataceae bacterium]|nr:HEAT repeat domain-containing protein [Gemmataceae bacterium]